MHLSVDGKIKIQEKGPWRRKKKGHRANMRLHSTGGSWRRLELGNHRRQAGQIYLGQPHNRKQGSDQPATVVTGTAASSLE